ncbi:MAG: hypothetical protein WBE20_00190 [Candidatus Acidiferrales bacterium]
MMTRIVKIEGSLDDLGKRFLSDAQLEADPALVAQGWERRFTADAQRVPEVTELYSQLGYEVRAEPVQSDDLKDDCEDCHSLIISRFKTIYTRWKRT